MLYMALISGAMAMVLVLLIIAIMQIKRRNTKRNESLLLKGIEAGICEQLYAACPDSKWRWVCKPAGFAVNGGIARVEVIEASGKQWFLDVCLSASGFMALHISNAAPLTATGVITTLSNQTGAANVPTPTAPQTDVKPIDEESVAKWYNIILFDALNTLIGDLYAKGEVCLQIGQNGKAFVERGSDGTTVVYDFGEMPDMALWGYIIDRLGGDGLFAEVQEENCIFISWA